MIMLYTLPDEKRPIRRDIFEFPHICEPALANADNQAGEQAQGPGRPKGATYYLALYRGRRQGWSCQDLARRWKGPSRATLYRQWQDAIAIVAKALVTELHDAAFVEYDPGGRVEIRAWRHTVGYMSKETGEWVWHEDHTAIDAIYRAEGDKREDEEQKQASIS